MMNLRMVFAALLLSLFTACTDYVQQMEDNHAVWQVEQVLVAQAVSSSAIPLSSEEPINSVVKSSSSVASSSSEEVINNHGRSSSFVEWNQSASPSSSSIYNVQISSSSSAPNNPAIMGLAASANPDYATNDYSLWKSFHFVTLEDESVYYNTLAADFGDVFTAQYLPAGRVVWTAQNVGYYKSTCGNEESSETAMRYRACTVSEGTGYGILLAYFNGDSETFNRIWNYSRAYREYSGQNLTPWINYSFHFKPVDYSSATDADLDIATALILMYLKTNSAPYLEDALKIVNAIWDNEINKNSLLIYSGDDDSWQGSEPIYNPSYFSPVALRLFALVDPNHNWTGVLDAMYSYMAKLQANGTGVFPDWSDEAGVAAKPNNGSAEKTYWTFHSESARIPWRIAWDYYWFQDERALAILQKLNAFIVTKSAGDPSSYALSVSYSWDPSKNDFTGTTTAVPSYKIGMWCATGLGTNPDWLNACTVLVNAAVPTNNNASYYADILLTMYSALLNGLFVKPF